MIEVARELVDHDVEAVRGRWFGSTAWVVYQVDQHEARRRMGMSCGAIASVGILGALATLPIGLTVPREWVPPAALFSIESAPSCAVQADLGGITRLLVPPTVPLLAVVDGPTWGLALDRASRFAPFCQRVIEVEDAPDDLEVLMLEAHVYGIGLFLEGELVIPPAPFVGQRFSPQRWLFAERVFQHHLALNQSSAVKTPSA